MPTGLLRSWKKSSSQYSRPIPGLFASSSTGLTKCLTAVKSGGFWGSSRCWPFRKTLKSKCASRIVQSSASKLHFHSPRLEVHEGTQIDMKKYVESTLDGSSLTENFPGRLTDTLSRCCLKRPVVCFYGSHSLCRVFWMDSKTGMRKMCS